MESDDSVFKDENGNYWRIDSWFPKIGDNERRLIKLFYDELVFFNKRLNLVSPKTIYNADLIHFADGILGSNAVFKRTDSQEIFDFGSGNGIPGVIMGILDPNRSFILVDVDSRKAEFLKHVVSRLGLKNVVVTTIPIQDIQPGSVKAAVCRGLASIGKCLLLTRKQFSENAEFFHFKGPTWSSELAAIPSQVLGVWDAVHSCDYVLPLGEFTRSIVLTRKKG